MDAACGQDDVPEDLENAVVALGVGLFANHGDKQDEDTQELISLVNSRCSTPGPADTAPTLSAKSDCAGTVRPSLTSTSERRRAIMEMHKLFREEFGNSSRDVNQAAASALRRLSEDYAHSTSQPVLQNEVSDDDRKGALDKLRKAFLVEIKKLSQETDANGAVARLLGQLGQTISVQKLSLENTENEELFVHPEASLVPKASPANGPAFAPTPRSTTKVGPMLPTSDPDDSRRGVRVGISSG